MSLRILIVDDHGVVRAGLRALLKEETRFQVVGEAATSDEGLHAALELKPDVVLMDLSIPGMGGLDLTRLLREKMPGTRIVILTVHEDGEILRAALTAGATGYVVKRAVGSELVSAIDAVMRGEIYVHPSMTRGLLDMKEQAGAQPLRGDPERLTSREVDVVRLLTSGHTNRQIAGRLSLSVRTVESHRARIMGKLGLSSRADLVRWAAEKNRTSSSITSLARLPAELNQEKRVVATSEYEPPRGAVVLDVTAKGGDGEEHVFRRRLTRNLESRQSVWVRFGKCLEQSNLLRADGVSRRRIRRQVRDGAQHEQSPGNHGEHRERVYERPQRFQLALLQGAPGLQRLEELFDAPPRPVGVNDGLDLFRRVDRFRREKTPADRLLPGGWIGLDDRDDVHAERLRIPGLETGAGRTWKRECGGPQFEARRPLVPGWELHPGGARLMPRSTGYQDGSNCVDGRTFGRRE